MTKTYIVFVILGALVVVGGSFYYIGNRNSDAAPSVASSSSSAKVVPAPVAAAGSGAMTPDRTAALILAYEKKNVGATQEMIVGSVAGSSMGASCGTYYNDPSSSLVNEGYLTLTTTGSYIGSYIPTAKAAPYVDTVRSNNQTYYLFLYQPENVMNITVATREGQNITRVWFDETEQLTPFGVSCSVHATQRHLATFKLYDDGWRVIAVF